MDVNLKKFKDLFKLTSPQILALPPAKKKMCPVIDQRIIEKSANKLKQHRKNVFTKELEMIQKRREEDLSKIQSGKPGPRDERDTQHQLANKGALKNLRDKEHEREKETKEHDKREKALHAAVNTGHMSNGISSPAHHRARVDHKVRSHRSGPKFNVVIFSAFTPRHRHPPRRHPPFLSNPFKCPLRFPTNSNLI